MKICNAKISLYRSQDALILKIYPAFGRHLISQRLRVAAPIQLNQKKRKSKKKKSDKKNTPINFFEMSHISKMQKQNKKKYKFALYKR